MHDLRAETFPADRLHNDAGGPDRKCIERLSAIPADWLAAMPMACAVEVASRPISFALAAAAPNTPQVAVICQPRA